MEEERETETETETESERKKERERERQTDRQRERDRQTERFSRKLFLFWIRSLAVSWQWSFLRHTKSNEEIENDTGILN